jgi:transposase
MQKTYIELVSVRRGLSLAQSGVYLCSECGNEIDRDYQASLNLAEYGRKLIA